MVFTQLLSAQERQFFLMQNALFLLSRLERFHKPLGGPRVDLTIFLHTSAWNVIDGNGHQYYKHKRSRLKEVTYVMCLVAIFRLVFFFPKLQVMP